MVNALEKRSVTMGLALPGMGLGEGRVTITFFPAQNEATLGLVKQLFIIQWC